MPRPARRSPPNPQIRLDAGVGVDERGGGGGRGLSGAGQLGTQFGGLVGVPTCGLDQGRGEDGADRSERVGMAGSRRPRRLRGLRGQVRAGAVIRLAQGRERSRVCLEALGAFGAHVLMTHLDAIWFHRVFGFDYGAPMDVRVVDHPLAAARLTTLRDERTDNAAFRAALRDLTLMLVYEATRDRGRRGRHRSTPRWRTTIGSRLAKPPLLVPVLRAGLGMVEQAHALIPEAQVGFVGVARDEETHQPTPYLESLPDDLSTQPVMVLDPMLATGGSMAHTLAAAARPQCRRHHRGLRGVRAGRHCGT